MLTFVLFSVVGGDASYQLAGQNATAEQIESIRQELGTDQSYTSQYIVFVRQIMTLDLGHSWQNQEKISEIIIRSLGASLCLTLPILFLSQIVSIFFALGITYFTKTIWDKITTTVCTVMMSFSILIYVIVYQYVFAYLFHWFPINGWNEGLWTRWHYLILPWIIGTIVLIGPNILLYRNVFKNEVFLDYVRTARAKGVSEFFIYFKHILKNSALPISTVIFSQVPNLIFGSVVLEHFFSLPGLGRVLVDGMQTADLPLIRALTVLSAILYLATNIVVDLCYAYFDPRVRLK